MKMNKSKQTLATTTSLPNSNVNRELLFINGKQYYDALMRDIDRAQIYIDLETYIFKSDTVGQLIADALIRAAKRGVTIRVLVDGAGSPQWGSNRMARRMEAASIKTRVFHPFPWHLWNWSRSVVRLPILLKWIYLLLKVNSRNHRKVCLIDNQIAYAGSCNICNSHLQASEGGDGWRDTAVRLEDFPLTELQDAFEMAWHHRSMKERIREVFNAVKQDPKIRLNHTWHRRRILHKNLLRRIKQSKERVWITNAYFVPDNFLLRHLKEAAARKVDVRILLPHKSDVFIMPWASSAFYEILLKSNIRIYEYLPNILHAKTLIIDDWMLVGSSNLNHRSLLHDYEVDVKITEQHTQKELQQQFLKDLEDSEEIKMKHWRKRSLWQRTLGRVLLYLKYWI